MARTVGKRNVVIIYTQAGDTTWRGRGVEVSADGTLTLGTAKTDDNLDELKAQLIQPFAAGGTTPENSALYSPHEVNREVFVAEEQIVA